MKCPERPDGAPLAVNAPPHDERGPAEEVRLAPMRVAVLSLFVAGVLACDSPPAFPVPGGPPLPVALDVQFRTYTMGTWALDSFSQELGVQLAKYNMTVVDKKTAPSIVAEVNLGVLANGQAIDVYIVRGGVRTSAGRVRVPDLSPTTLEVSAQLVAPLIARPAWGVGSGGSE